MYNLKNYIFTIIVLILSIINIINCNAQVTLQSLIFKEGKTTLIKNVIDLKGEELLLPKNITLSFEKGGCLKNGKITADNTSIIGYKKGIFRRTSNNRNQS